MTPMMVSMRGSKQIAAKRLSVKSGVSITLSLV